MHAMVNSMPTPGAEIADSLGILLRRSSRAHLYTRLTAGLGDALDEATYPVISGLDRYGPRSAAQLAEDICLDRSVGSRLGGRPAALPPGRGGVNRPGPGSFRPPGRAAGPDRLRPPRRRADAPAAG